MDEGKYAGGAASGGAGAYVVPLDDSRSKGKSAPPSPSFNSEHSSPDDASVVVWPDLSGCEFPGVSTRDLFPSGVARVNRLLLGMDVLGAGDAQPAVHAPRYLAFWAVFAMHQASQTMLIFYALGLHTVPAIIAGVLVMTPMVALTAWVERDLYRSPVLGHRLLDQDDPKIKAFQKSCSSYIGLLVESTLFYQIPIIILPSFLLVLPVLRAANSPAAWFVLFWVSMGMNALIFTISIWTWVWQPLIELHQNETIRLTQVFAVQCMRILDSKEMSPAAACEALGVLHEQLGKPLRDDIKHTFEPNIRGYVVGVISAYTACACLVLLPVDADHISAVKDVAAPETFALMRYGFAAAMMVLMPLLLRSIMFGMRKVSMAWECTVERGLVNSATLRRAVQKFDGDARTFEMWLEKNRLTVRLFGYPVDAALPGKVMAGLVSLAGAVAVVAFRASNVGV